MTDCEDTIISLVTENMKTLKLAFLTTSLFTLFACTQSQPVTKTGIGAAAGGALGAGLGAIIGSQTGDAGAGLAIGTLAGSAGGAMIGNALQMQDEKYESQNEKLLRQERTIAQQQSEIDELKNLTSSERSMLKNSVSRKTSPSIPHGGPSYMSRSRSLPKSVTKTVAALPKATTNCKDAEKELQAANAEKDSSTKLFHLRRALRLCPENALYHVELARVYKYVGREDDAKFELQEALKIDPDNALAKALNRY